MWDGMSQYCLTSLAVYTRGLGRAYDLVSIDVIAKTFAMVLAMANVLVIPTETTTNGHYKAVVELEQVRIPYDKPFIYLKGEGQRKTYIVWDGHDSTATSATFTSQADNTIAKHITFINSYNSPRKSNNPMRPAVAAMIQGDKSAFHRCGFFGLQDTLWDEQGRHYFRRCSIQGAVDFIFGAGQSIYEATLLLKEDHMPKIPTGSYSKLQHSRKWKTFLGRPWREYARVVFYNTSMSSIVVPQGWDAWFSAGREFKHLKESEVGEEAKPKVFEAVNKHFIH
ncbi:putative pectinesterase 29 [Sesamum angolense]|uniref:Pectinesterase n=1 Tax=Sesamum angolense TaxID=2727404 RepID=A0AAE1W772_9LAMI|nr:putative pectinesterase 29 [Sesamum angolense]